MFLAVNSYCVSSLTAFSENQIKPAILAIAFHECKTWRLALNDQRDLQLSEEKVTTTILGPKKKQRKRRWRNRRGHHNY
jgi:hypothetical protein